MGECGFIEKKKNGYRLTEEGENLVDTFYVD